ncbi:hypothetical protein FGO68_gene14683 [Halteria grandinella]|uniref:Uncharacterized protein n=1 Tax=Halteria grandinella TaxID=5974 RepID=A0A8J8P2C5_HALGN|nr:hypothetical protein FGO68_gene14683 [Halteria grandinella]
MHKRKPQILQRFKYQKQSEEIAFSSNAKTLLMSISLVCSTERIITYGQNQSIFKKHKQPRKISKIIKSIFLSKMQKLSARSSKKDFRLQIQPKETYHQQLKLSSSSILLHKVSTIMPKIRCS